MYSEYLKLLVDFSRRYGGDERFVLAGGGNTSCKEDGFLYVKASGTQLAQIDENGFVKMEIPKLLEMMEKTYPAGDAEREQSALSDVMAAVSQENRDRRPSVECLLHALFPYTYVLHLHPALVNGVTCAKKGAETIGELFGDSAVWIPLTKPGYILAMTCHKVFQRYADRGEACPKILFMQNHGIIVAADTVTELDELMDMVMERIGGVTPASPSMKQPDTGVEFAADELKESYSRHAGSGYILFHTSPTVSDYVKDENSMKSLLLPFTPDQIVYCKNAFLVLDIAENRAAAFSAFLSEHGFAPKAAILKGVGIIALGADKKEAETVLSLFLDAVRIAFFSEFFGGPHPLPEEFISFITGWEAENYRQKKTAEKDDRYDEAETR